MSSASCSRLWFAHCRLLGHLNLYWVCHLCGDCYWCRLWWYTRGKTAHVLKSNEKTVLRKWPERREKGYWQAVQSASHSWSCTLRRTGSTRDRGDDADILACLCCFIFSSHVGLGFNHIALTLNVLPVLSQSIKTHQTHLFLTQKHISLECLSCQASIILKWAD